MGFMIKAGLAKAISRTIPGANLSVSKSEGC